MLAKCSVVVGMFVLKDDAKSEQKGCCHNPLEHIPSCSLLGASPRNLPKKSLSPWRSAPFYCPVSFLPLQSQGPGNVRAQQPGTKLPPIHLVKRKNLLMSHQRGVAVQDCLSRLLSPVPGQFPSHSLAFLLTLLVALLCLGSGHAWVQQVENFIRNVDCYNAAPSLPHRASCLLARAFLPATQMTAIPKPETD